MTTLRSTVALRTVLMRGILALATLLIAGTLLGQNLTTAECLDCHKDPTLTKDVNGKAVSVAVNETTFKASIHGGMFECSECHADVKAYPHEPAPKAVDCASCHSEAVAAWRHSRHAAGVKQGMHAARCVDCHGPTHDILPSADANSSTNHARIPQTCGTCHGQKFVMEQAGLSNQMFVSYQQSVHGRAVAKGSMKAAVCTDCHDYHASLPANDPQSSIFKFNVPRTCGKCHAKVTGQFLRSVHGTAITRGNWTAPVCTDCHGIHAIKSKSDVASSVSSANVARSTCANCHGGVRLSQEYGLPTGRVESYKTSYHGLARQLGSPVAANCASCHGVHDILPSSNPKSAVNKANLQKTCGKCHEGASAKFTMGRIHLTEGEQIDTQSIVITWIRRVYMALIWGTIGFMVLHNILVWWRKAADARRSPDRTIERMNLHQRVQHFLLVTSFITLVLTGFALAYPDSPFAWMFGSSEAPRRIIHRIAAVVMMALGAYHVGYMVGTREGRQGLKDFWFRWKDARDFYDAFRYYTGGAKHPPRMARFTYGEKAEYWAVVWGTIVMGVTGMMIWYSVIATTWIPRWWIDIATTIHLYEAVLATLSILVWHLYNVIFDPDAYPMNWAWYDGKMSEHHFEHEHALEYERMRKEKLLKHTEHEKRE